MTAKPCLICGKMLDGWVYDNRSYMKNIEKTNPHIIGFQCFSCGAVVCAYIHDKQMKAGAFSGLFKVTCPTCGKPFGPPSALTSREIPGLSPIDQPSSNLETWAETLIDTVTGEQLISARLFDDFFKYKLVLTDRRLIHIRFYERKMWNVDSYSNQDNFFGVLPLNQILSVKIDKNLTGATRLMVKSKNGEELELTSKNGPLDTFGQALQDSLPNALPAVIFPDGEQVYSDINNLGFLWTDHLPQRIAPEVHRMRFYNTLRLSLAVTNHRLLFYRITHIEKLDIMSTGASATLGRPGIQFISIPWENIKRIYIDKSFMTKGVNLVLNTPVWAWQTWGLNIYPHHEITVEEIQHVCAKCGGTITGGVGLQRKASGELAIDDSQTGWYCPTCNTSFHKDKKCSSSKNKCPKCKQPMQAIDRSYPKVTLSGRALTDASYLLTQSPAVPPLGVADGEWNLPIMENLKAWEQHVLPAVKQSQPLLQISVK